MVVRAWTSIISEIYGSIVPNALSLTTSALTPVIVLEEPFPLWYFCSPYLKPIALTLVLWSRITRAFDAKARDTVFLMLLLETGGH